MNKILLVLKNLRHDGADLAVGSLFEADINAFQGLVDMGVLRVIEGAKTLEEAEQIVKTQIAAGASKVAPAAAASQDKFKAAPDKPVETPPAPAPEVQANSTADASKVAPESSTVEAPVVGTGDVAPAPLETGDNL
jgi:hypothetical protein